MERPELDRPELDRPDTGSAQALLLTEVRARPAESDFLPRPRWTERLERPPGAAWCWCERRRLRKTSLMASTGHGTASSRVAWLSLDASDKRPGTILAPCGGRPRAGLPGIGERGGPMLGPTVPQSVAGAGNGCDLITEWPPGPRPKDRTAGPRRLPPGGSSRHASLGSCLDHLQPGPASRYWHSRDDPPDWPGDGCGPGAAHRAARKRAALSPMRPAGFLRETAGADLPDAAVAALTGPPRGGGGCRWRRCR